MADSKIVAIMEGTGRSKAPAELRLTRGEFFADILLDQRDNSHVYHWIVQKSGSPEILQMGQARSYDEARRCAEQSLALVAKSRKRA